MKNYTRFAQQLMMPPTDIIYRFVPMGTIAPSTLPPGEFWLDVGHRAKGRVLDHHGGDTAAWSATQLVLNNADQIRKDLAQNPTPMTLVTHQSPDLDAVAAVWLMQKIVAGDPIEAERDWIDPIVETVSLNDQGMVRTSHPDKCWPIVMRLMLAVEYAQYDDKDRLKAGVQLVESTFSHLRACRSLPYAVHQLISPSVTKAIAHAEDVYRKDRANGMKFQVKLPTRKNDELDAITNIVKSEKKPYSPLREPLTDALFLNNPHSVLFKELARGDCAHSSLGRGFQLLVVAIKILHIEEVSVFQYRYVISIDPLSSKHLEGLGDMLTKRETEKGRKSSFILTEKDCKLAGQRKYGDMIDYPVWYNGSGHNYTIIDSPMIRINGKDVCVSCLSMNEIIETIQFYGERLDFDKFYD